MLERQREQFESNPSNRAAFAALQEGYYVAGEWDELIELYQIRLTAPDLEKDVNERARITMRLAQVLEERRASPDEAFELYLHVVRFAPKHRAAIARLRAIYAEREQWEMVLQMAELEEQVAMTPAEKIDFQVDVGEVWLDKLNDPSQAKQFFASAAEQAPGNFRALEGLAKCLQALNQAEEAADVLQRLINRLGSGPDCARALVKLASLYEGPLDRANESNALFRRAHTEDPKNIEAIEALIIIAAAQNQWDVLSDLQERHFQLVTGARLRSAIALEAGLLQLERLGNTSTARHWLERAKELTPDDPEIHLAFATLERTESNPAGQKEALDQVVALEGEGTPTEIILERASLCAEAGEDEEAIRGLRIALERWPESHAVLEMLTNLFRRNDRYPELVEVLEQRAAVESIPPEERAAVLAQLGAVHEEQFSDHDLARDAYERAFLSNPTILDVAPALERLYIRDEAWGDLRRFLEEALLHSPENQRAGLLCTLGELVQERFDDGDLARSLYEEALDIDPESARALAGLERIALGSGDPEAILSTFVREAKICTDPMRLEELVSEIVPRLEELGQESEALIWLQRLLEINPRHTDTLVRCAEMQENLGHTADLCDTLEKIAASLEGDALAENQKRRAKLLLLLERTDDAIPVFLASLEIQPENLETLTMLEPLLRDQGRLSELADVQSKLIELMPEEERIPKLRELAELVSEGLGDVHRALEICQKLQDAGDENSDQLFEELLERSEETSKLVEQLERRSQRFEPDSSEALDLDLKRAEFLLDPLERFEEAAELYRSIRERDSDITIRSITALLGIERAARASNDIEALVKVLAERADCEDEEQRKESIELERAMLFEDVLDDTESARGIYAKLCESQNDPLIAIEASERLERLLERAEAWKDLADLLRTRVGQGVPNDDFELHRRLTSLCRDKLSRIPEAADHLRSMIELRPEMPELWQELASLFNEKDHPDELRKALEGELETKPESSREIALRAQAAHLNEALENAEGAETHYKRLLELDPGNIDGIDFLAKHLEEREDWHALTQVLEKRRATLMPSDSETDRNVERRVDLRVRIAGLFSEKLDDKPAAVESLEAALEETRNLAVPGEPLAKLFEALEEHSKLLALCQRIIDESEVRGELADWHFRQGKAQVALGMHREASTAFHHAISERPNDPEIEVELRDTYRELGEAAPLAQMLESQLADLTGNEEIPVRLELAKLLGSELERPEDALLHLKRVLEVDSTQKEALDSALEIADQLGESESLLELLDTAKQRATDSNERAQFLARRASMLAGPMDRTDDAIAAYREAISLNPADHEIRKSLRELFERLNRWPQVLDCLLLEARNVHGSERRRIYENAAELAWQHISPDAALPWFSRLLAKQPDDAEILGKIQEIHRQADRPEALLRTLETELTLDMSPERKLDLHLEMAKILENSLSSPGRAIHCIEAARQDAHLHPVVLRELDRLYRITNRSRERAQILEARIANTQEGDVGALHQAAATLFEKELREPVLAAEHFYAALNGAKGVQRVELLQALGRVLRGANRPASWAKVTEEELLSLDSDAPVFVERRRELHRDLATAYEKQLSQPDRAIQHYQELITLLVGDPSSTRTELTSAEERLLDLLRREGSHADLAHLLETRLAREEGEPEEWLELARLYQEHLFAPVRAMEAYKKVLEHWKDSLQALRGLRSVSEQTGNWAELAKTLEAELELSDEMAPSGRAALLRRLGNVTWKHLDSTTGASQAYAAAIECNPGDLESIRALEHLFEAMADWRGAIDLYESEIDVLNGEDEERRVEVWLRVSEIAFTNTEESERAIHALEQASEIRELFADRKIRLAELYQEQGNLEKFADVFATWCDDPESGSTADHHLQLARSYEELERPDTALERVERALEVDPQNPAAWDASALLRQEKGDIDGAASAYEKSAELLEPDAAATHLIQAAELVVENDMERAAEILKRAIERDPASANAHANFARVAAELGRLERAEHSAGKALDLATSELAMHVDLRFETALIGAECATKRDRLEEASRFYAAALKLQPKHPDALAAHGEVLIGLEDHEGACEALEARLELPGDNPERATHRMLLGKALEARGKHLAALKHYQDALDEDESLQASHEGVVRILELKERQHEAITALVRWSKNAEEPAEAATHLVRAAQLNLEQGNRDQQAEERLRKAQEIYPENALSWVLLAELIMRTERSEEALEIATSGLEYAEDSSFRSRLHMVRAKGLEANSQRNEAADAYRRAAEADGDCIEGALSGARLMRAMGEWRNAAGLLENFTHRHDGGDPILLAEVYHQLARLQAGPLEDLEGAIVSYRSALKQNPDLQSAKEALAELLSHRPADWDEAIRRHQQLLEANPVRVASIRALIQIALGRRRFEAAENGQAILRALGIISPEDRDEAPSRLSLRIASTLSMENPLWERLRQVAIHTRTEIAQARGASDNATPPPSDGGDPLARFRNALLSAEGDLAAPALVLLSTEELGNTLTLVSQIAYQSDQVTGDGNLVNALSANLGVLRRRKVRKILVEADPEEISTIDFDSWRAELRKLAATVALDETDGELYPAVAALLQDATDVDQRNIQPNADLTPLAANCPEVLDLLRRTYSTWVRTI